MRKLRYAVISVFLLTVLLALSPGCRRGGVEGIDSGMLRRLDSAISVHGGLMERKAHSLNLLKGKIHAATDPAAVYSIYSSLYSEYYNLNIDSAVKYSGLKARLAQEMGDSTRYTISMIENARAYMLLGSYYRADSIIAALRPSMDLNNREVALAYYDLNANRNEINKLDPSRWLDLKSGVLDSESADWVYNTVNILSCEGKYDEALKLLNGNPALLESDDHSRGITRYLAGKIHYLKGDTVAAINELAESAYYDLLTPVCDSWSIYRLAILLFKKGKTEQAYRLINAAAIDSNMANENHNMRSIISIVPDIMRRHDEQQHARRTADFIIILCFSGLSVVLALLLYVAIVARRRADAANSKLQELNSRLESVNSVKDAYIMSYLGLCSNYLNSFEQFRNSVSSAIRSQGTQGVEKLLARVDDEKNIKLFYTNFDETFLKLFPDFIDKFNALIVPTAHVSLNREGGMTNELRTFALIRLGVTDSSQIAAFLRRSVSTVYNYRVKMRNAALGNRDEFEEKVAAL